jgi:drug/metabolite transporter (DMT)-like permease
MKRLGVGVLACWSLWIAGFALDRSVVVIMPLTENTKQYVSHGLLLTSQLCFSGWHIVGSIVLKDGASPFVFALYRELVASLLMFCIVKYYGKKIYLFNEDRVRFLILGFFSFANVVGAILSLNYISPTRFAIFQPVIPCIATIISVFIGIEPFTIIKLCGICIAVSGAILTEAWKEDSSSNDDDEKDVMLGTIIVSLQVTAMACLVVFSKPILNKYNSAVTTFFFYSIGTCYTVILFCIVAFTFTANDLYFDGEMMPWLGLAYVSTFATVYTYNALSWGGRHLSPSTTTVYSTFQPVGTMILSLLLLNKVVTTPELVGAALVILGLIVTVYGQNYDNIKHAFRQRQTVEEGDGPHKDLLADHYRFSDSSGTNHSQHTHNSDNDGVITINSSLEGKTIRDNSGAVLSQKEQFLDQEYNFQQKRPVSFSSIPPISTTSPPPPTATATAGMTISSIYHNRTLGRGNHGHYYSSVNNSDHDGYTLPRSNHTYS